MVSEIGEEVRVFQEKLPSFREKQFKAAKIGHSACQPQLGKNQDLQLDQGLSRRNSYFSIKTKIIIEIRGFATLQHFYWRLQFQMELWRC